MIGPAEDQPDLVAPHLPLERSGDELLSVVQIDLPRSAASTKGTTQGVYRIFRSLVQVDSDRTLKRDLSSVKPVT